MATVEQTAGGEFDKIFEEFTEGGDFETGSSSSGASEERRPSTEHLHVVRDDNGDNSHIENGGGGSVTSGGGVLLEADQKIQCSDMSSAEHLHVVCNENDNVHHYYKTGSSSCFESGDQFSTEHVHVLRDDSNHSHYNTTGDKPSTESSCPVRDNENNNNEKQRIVIFENTLVLPGADLKIKHEEKPSTEPLHLLRDNKNNNGKQHIVIFEDVICDETTERRLALRKGFRTNLYKLRRRLNLISDERWVNWLQSAYFKPIWSMLWWQWMGYHCTEIIEPLRSEVFQLCITKYRVYISRHCVLPTNFAGTEHMARFLALMVLRNFGLKALCKAAVAPEPLYLMWAVLLVVKLAHAPKNIGMPRGGKALLTRPYEELVKVTRY